MDISSISAWTQTVKDIPELLDAMTAVFATPGGAVVLVLVILWSIFNGKWLALT